MKELGLTLEQGERFRTQLQRILGSDSGSSSSSELETWRLEFAVAYMARLRAIVAFVAVKAQAQVEGVRAILTPAQFIRFAAWSDRNAAAIGAVLGSGAGRADGGGAGGAAAAAAAAAASASSATAAAVAAAGLGMAGGAMAAPQRA